VAALSDAGVSVGCASSTALVLRPSEAAATVMNKVDLRILILHPDGGAGGGHKRPANELRGEPD
jgi:hypothetical protein